MSYERMAKGVIAVVTLLRFYGNTELTSLLSGGLSFILGLETGYHD
jgi:hypothetical protein